jgi:hypothetical protein
MKQRVPVNRISKKKLKALGGRVPFSSITKKPTTKIRAVNPEREAKRRKEYAKKLAAYKRSDTYKVVQRRAAGQCEFEIAVIRRLCFEGEELGMGKYKARCPETERLQHHHLDYHRFGGNELPEDIQVLCKAHHEWMDRDKPSHKR